MTKHKDVYFTTFFRKNVFGINCQYLILVWEFVSVFAYKLEIYCNPGIFNWVTVYIQ